MLAIQSHVASASHGAMATGGDTFSLVGVADMGIEVCFCFLANSSRQRLAWRDGEPDRPTHAAGCQRLAWRDGEPLGAVRPAFGRKRRRDAVVLGLCQPTPH